MAILREHDVPLASLSTFRIGGSAREIVTLETEADVAEFFAALPTDAAWLVLGGGSNVVFPDGDTSASIIRLGMREIALVSDEGMHAEVSIGAGVVWDDACAWAVARGLCGIEALSAIPGSTGATPIQNVGAYGTEIKDVLVSVRAYDRERKAFVELANAECTFAYRDSLFKHARDAAGRPQYVITEVRLRLSRAAAKPPRYPGVAEYFAAQSISKPSLAQIRTAIIAIRAKKLPDPREIASVGSFFKNPFVSEAEAKDLAGRFPDMKMFPTEDGRVKIPAGWLIENAGLKGKSFGSIKTYEHNALVLVNTGTATRADLAAAVVEIVGAVNDLFGIRLEPEPELL